MLVGELLEEPQVVLEERPDVLHLMPEVPDVLAAAGGLAGDLIDTMFGGLSKARMKRLVVLLQRFVTAPATEPRNSN